MLRACTGPIFRRMSSVTFWAGSGSRCRFEPMTAGSPKGTENRSRVRISRRASRMAPRRSSSGWPGPWTSPSNTRPGTTASSARSRSSTGPRSTRCDIRPNRRPPRRGPSGAQPVRIGETGVPSSRGIAHLQPQGWNHGGHTERAQGEIDARLMMDIDEAGLAGGVLFALLDEWFKRNWMVFDFEVPAERKPLWLNVLDPEENYGLLAARPGATSWKVKVDGRAEDWNGVAPLVTRPEGGPERPFK